MACRTTKSRFEDHLKQLHLTVEKLQSTQADWLADLQRVVSRTVESVLDTDGNEETNGKKQRKTNKKLIFGNIVNAINMVKNEISNVTKMQQNMSNCNDANVDLLLSKSENRLKCNPLCNRTTQLEYFVNISKIERDLVTSLNNNIIIRVIDSNNKDITEQHLNYARQQKQRKNSNTNVNPNTKCSSKSTKKGNNSTNDNTKRNVDKNKTCKNHGATNIAPNIITTPVRGNKVSGQRQNCCGSGSTTNTKPKVNNYNFHYGNFCANYNNINSLTAPRKQKVNMNRTDRSSMSKSRMTSVSIPKFKPIIIEIQDDDDDNTNDSDSGSHNDHRNVHGNASVNRNIISNANTNGRTNISVNNSKQNFKAKNGRYSHPHLQSHSHAHGITANPIKHSNITISNADIVNHHGRRRHVQSRIENSSARNNQSGKSKNINSKKSCAYQTIDYNKTLHAIFYGNQTPAALLASLNPISINSTNLGSSSPEKKNNGENQSTNTGWKMIDKSKNDTQRRMLLRSGTRLDTDDGKNGAVTPETPKENANLPKSSKNSAKRKKSKKVKFAGDSNCNDSKDKNTNISLNKIDRDLTASAITNYQRAGINSTSNIAIQASRTTQIAATSTVNKTKDHRCDVAKLNLPSLDMCDYGKNADVTVANHTEVVRRADTKYYDTNYDYSKVANISFINKSTKYLLTNKEYEIVSRWIAKTKDKMKAANKNANNGKDSMKNKDKKINSHSGNIRYEMALELQKELLGEANARTIWKIPDLIWLMNVWENGKDNIMVSAKHVSHNNNRHRSKSTIVAGGKNQEIIQVKPPLAKKRKLCQQ